VKSLKSYVDRKNKWNALFGGCLLVIGQDNQKIASMIDSELSSENLACDGELNRAEVNRRYRKLTAAARDLGSLDPKVKFPEFS
jgi:hypothetical protein